jgi:hypothetical protein
MCLECGGHRVSPFDQPLHVQPPFIDAFTSVTQP